MKRKIFLTFALLLLVITACNSDNEASLGIFPGEGGLPFDGGVTHMPATPPPSPMMSPQSAGGFEPGISRSREMESYTQWGMTEMEMAIVATDVAAPPTHNAPPEIRERHIIQTANIQLETEYFDDVVAELRQLAPAAEGYVESEMLTTHGRRMLTMVLRIPAARFDTVLNHVENLAVVISLNQRAEDVTDQFYDLAANLETRRIEEERILVLLESAVNINDILSLESRLSSVRLVIEQHQAQLNNLAGQIAYSTIVVTLTDSYEEEPTVVAVTLGERIGGAFGDSVDGTVGAFQNLAVFLAGAVIPLIFLGLLVFIAYFIFKKAHKRWIL